MTNILIDALPEPSRQKLTAQLTKVNVPLRTSLYEPDVVPKYAHFLTSGIASIVITGSDGSTVEVGTLGREGVPQAMHLLGHVPVPTRCFMQIAGTGYRMEFAVLQRLWDADPALRQTLLAYVQYHAMPSLTHPAGR